MPPRLPILGFARNRGFRHRQPAFIGAAAGFYYYFKVILAIYTAEGATEEPRKVSNASKGIAVALAVVIVALGVNPKPLQKVLAALASRSMALGK